MGSVQLRDVCLGTGRPKVIVPVMGTTVEELLARASDLSGVDLDIVEWRVDHLAPTPSPTAIAGISTRLREVIGNTPLLFTFRTRGEGGAQDIAPGRYEELNVAAIASGMIDAVDVEHRFDRSAGDAVMAAAARSGVAVIGSVHDFAATPARDELVTELVAMQERGCAVVKAAVMPHSPGDVLELMTATWTMTSRHPATPVMTMAMGGLGLITRLCPQLLGGCATFATVGEASAPGQVPVAEIRPLLDVIAAHLPTPAVALIGLPGSGKSTVGPRLARRLGVPHLDVDHVLEQRQGRSIAEIFASDGEAHFREIERDLTLELLASPGVLSLGGGAPMTPAIAQALAGHPVVWLQVTPEQAARRVGRGRSRPLLAGEAPLDRLRRLLEERGPTYDHLATITVDTSNATTAEVVETIRARLCRRTGPRSVG